jgi:transposase InsO family protein
VRFSFIHAEKAHFPVQTLCRVLCVTRQGYYQFVQRGVSARERANAELQQRVRRIFDESRQTYGSPRIMHVLRDEGFSVSKKSVERAMLCEGISGQLRRKTRATTKADPTATPAENTLARDFTATRPDQRWVTDITYVQTDEGWGYVAAILDLFSRKVVGWALDTTLETRLPLAALDMALQHRCPEVGLLHHSDRGCQYTSAAYREALAKRGIRVSMSRRGNCWDNAVAESFFATLKTELIHRQKWRSLAELRGALFEYIHVFYNRQRRHSSLGYKTPAQVEETYHLDQAA